MVSIYIQYDWKNVSIDIDGIWKNETYTKLQHKCKLLHNTNYSRKKIKKKNNMQFTIE